jgi:Golgi phosphoprotein 3 (GPP34)
VKPVQTIADDLLLLLLDDQTGKPRIDRTRLDYALAGAVLLELALDHRIDVLRGPHRRAAVVVGIDSHRIDDEILDEALLQAGERPRRADRLVPVVSKGLRRRLLARAQRNGHLRREHRRILGLLPVERWRAVDPTRAQELSRRLRSVLVDGAPPDLRGTALITLLASVDAASQVVGSLQPAEREAARSNARRIGQGAWAAEAVRRAVEAVQTAVAAGTVGAVVAGTSAAS